MLKALVLTLSAVIICADPTNIFSHKLLNRSEKFLQNRPNILTSDETLSYRLPNDSIPLRYDITLTTQIDQKIFEFSGNVKIHVKIVEPTRAITLHYRQIEIDMINIWLPGGSIPVVLDATYDLIESHDFLIIKLPVEVDPDTEYLIDISYHGVLRDEAFGFYRGFDIVDEQGNQKWYAATQFQIDDARHAFPCYDEPGIRAVMSLSVIHGKSYNALSSMEVVDKVDLGDSYMTKFAPSPVMQTYTLAIIVSDHEYIQASETSRIPQRIYGSSNLIQNGYGDFAASIVGDVLNKFEEILHVEYPLSKMDHVGLSKTGSAAMENFGLVTYHSYLLFIDPIISGHIRKLEEESVLRIVAHEIAHHWFGNLLSPKWWQYTWLNEGFATFFSFYVMDKMIPEINYMQRFSTPLENLFYLDVGNSWSLNHYTENPNELTNKFGTISYNKGACIIRMYMEFLTEDVFLKAMTIYLQNNYMKAVTAADLHAAFQEAYDLANPGNTLHLSDIMSTWEDQAGYPLISVTISGSNIILSQKRYSQSNGELYAVPISFATKSNPDFSTKTPKFWLNFPTLTIPQANLGLNQNDWIILNIQQTGYYRVDYDPKLWDAIIKQLNNDHSVIDLINRVALLSEFYLSWNDLKKVSVADALSIVNYMDKEDHYYTWFRAPQILMKLNQLIFGTGIYEENFFALIRKITKPHLLRLGYDEQADESIDDIYFRNILKEWNCHALDGDCLAKDYVKFILYRMGMGEANFDFCNVLKIAATSDFQGILTELTTNRDMNHRMNFLDNMGCSLNEENLKLILATILDPHNGLYNFERERMLLKMIESSNLGLKMSIKFIDEHYSEVYDLVFIIYDILAIIAERVKHEEMIVQFESSLQKFLSIDAIQSSYYEILMDRVKTNQKWMEQNYYDVLVFFGLEEPTVTEEPTTTPGPTEEPTTTPGPTEEPTTTPVPTEVPTTTPVPTEAPTTTPVPTEAPTTTPGPTEAPTTTPVPTEVPTTTTTTNPPPTTPDKGTSIIVSLGLIIACLLINIL